MHTIITVLLLISISIIVFIFGYFVVHISKEIKNYDDELDSDDEFDDD